MRRALGLGRAGLPGTPPAVTDHALPGAVLGEVVGHRTGQRDRQKEGAERQSAFASQLSERVTTLEAQLTTEREQHGETRRRQQQAELAARALAARTEHDALAHQEELEAVRQNTVKAQRVLDAALFETQQRKDAKQITPARSHAAAKPRLDAAALERPKCSVSPKTRGRPRTRPIPEQKPVRWWTPSYRAKNKG